LTPLIHFFSKIIRRNFIKNNFSYIANISYINSRLQKAKQTREIFNQRVKKNLGNTEYLGKNLESEVLDLDNNNLEEEFLYESLQNERKRVHLGILYTIMGDKEMKDFDSTYIGNKKEWRREMGCFKAFFKGRLLPSDYRIIGAQVITLLLCFDFLSKCMNNGIKHHDEDALFGLGKDDLTKILVSSLFGYFIFNKFELGMMEYKAKLEVKGSGMCNFTFAALLNFIMIFIIEIVNPIIFC
jgi:hypothetical protein